VAQVALQDKLVHQVFLVYQVQVEHQALQVQAVLQDKLEQVVFQV
jgi:hypothetical protein